MLINTNTSKLYVLGGVCVTYEVVIEWHALLKRFSQVIDANLQ